MARINLIQGNFSSGEITPKSRGRVDLERYLSSVATLTNFIILPQGGFYRRSGSVFASEIKDSAVKATLIPFEVSKLAAYMIEAGNLYFRFYVNQGLLISGTPVEVVTPYLEADLPLLDYTQNADTLFLVHPSYQPKLLQRTSVTSFAISNFDYQDGPYMTINTNPDWKLAPSGNTGSVTITATGTGFTPFVATDVGRWVRIRHGAVWGAAKITAYTDSVTVTAQVKVTLPFGATTAQQDWRLGSWSNTTGWPSTITFHEGRLVFSCTAAEPDGVWMSESGIYNLFSPTQPDVTVTDANGLGYTLASNKVNAVQWLLSARTLLLGTFGSEWAIRSTSQSQPITPTNISVQQQSSFGSKKVKPCQIGSSSIYVQTSGRKLREMTYNYVVDGWESNDISVLSEHLFRKGGGIVQACYQQEPDSVWWGVRNDGTLIGMTYLKNEKVIGFHKHIFGGSFSGGQAVVESCGVIPNPDGTQDQLWLIIKRTINGTTKRYVEYLDKPFLPEDDADKTEMNFVDSSITYDGAATTLITGLNHLAGEQVAVCGDTTERPMGTVSGSGQLTLQDEVSLARIGYKFVSEMATLPLAAEGDRGTGQGKIKRIDRIFLRFYQTINAIMGPSPDKLKPVIFLKTTSDMDVSPPLFTGDKDVYFNDDYNYLGVYLLRQESPYPMTVLATMPQLVIEP